MRNFVLILSAFLVLFGGWWWTTRHERTPKIGITLPTATPFPTPTPTPGIDTLVEDIKRELASRHTLPEGSVTLTIGKKNDGHATGSVRFANQEAGSFWFGTKQDVKWVVAYEGPQLIDCETANKYKFPTEMVPQCFDEKSNLVKKR